MEGTVGLDMLGWPWAIAAALACVAVIACALFQRRSIGPATFVWSVPFAAIAAFFAVWCALGLCQISAPDFCLCQLACALLGIAVLQRERVARALRSGALPSLAKLLLPWIRDAVLLAVAMWASFVALESADNPDWASIAPALQNQGLLVVGLALLCLYFLGQRRGCLCVVVPVACAVFGLVQNFLDLFKNTALLPSDVAAWQTAAAVSGGYTYILPTAAIQCIVYAALAIAALAFIGPARREKAAKPGKGAHSASPKRIAMSPARILANLALAVLCAYGVWYNVSELDYKDAFEVKLDYWDLRNSYREHGFLVSFITALQELRIDEPTGYSDESALALQDELARLYDEQHKDGDGSAQFERTKPNVIAIMNESYSDLSLFQNLHDGYEGTYVIKNLEGCAEKGWLAMSVHGGGTCNSEFEFMAFSSMGFLSGGMYPYQQFKFSKLPTLASAFRQLGYGTWGMHPNYPGNWNREFVYADMGMDNSLFIYDFEDSEMFHGAVSDRETYKRALQIIEESDEPQFVFDVTMQNHSGYDTGTIPAADMTDLHPDFLDDEGGFELNEYLSCVKESDEALKYLIENLRKLDEPVAVAFFGDHQPSLSRDLNDALFTDEPELEHKVRIAETPYFIWTNYEVEASSGTDGKTASGAASSANTDGKTTSDAGEVAASDSNASESAGAPSLSESSPNFLAARLLETIGAPLSPYQKALLVLHQQIAAVNTNGYCDSQGTWHDASEGEAADHPYHQLQVIHYLNVVRNL